MKTKILIIIHADGFLEVFANGNTEVTARHEKSRAPALYALREVTIEKMESILGNTKTVVTSLTNIETLHDGTPPQLAPPVLAGQKGRWP